MLITFRNSQKWDTVAAPSGTWPADIWNIENVEILVLGLDISCSVS